LGLRTAARRAYHAFRIRSGRLERLDPATPFGPAELAPHLINGETLATMYDHRRRGDIHFFFQSRDLPTFRPNLLKLLDDSARNDLLRQCDALAKGRVRFFNRWDADLGLPIDWHMNPVTGSRRPPDGHWTRCSQLDPLLGDIKLVWEANRFAFAYALTRAYALTSDAAHLRLGLRLIDEWIESNPPARGVNWNCGQETSFRLMAWLFLLHASYGNDALSTDLFAKIAASIYRQAARIDHHIGFAVSLQNNHGLSEALGLYTIGCLFPEFDRAARWRRKGRLLLESQIREQFFPDGAYIQHSFNYHRVALHDALWAFRLADLHGEPFPADIRDRLGHAVEFLYQVQDETSGRVPNYGANDGALVLPLDSCDYLDYRPVIQAGVYLLQGNLRYAAGPWDEALLWLFGANAQTATVEPVPVTSQAINVGGYYTLRGRESWAMIRCHTYRTRPNQADMLHLDLWWRGHNILRDSGTFSYNAPPWDHFFKSTAAHNTVEVDGLDQMTKGPRFLWFDWTRSRLLQFIPDDGRGGSLFQGEHDGYVERFGITHRRTVERTGDVRWTITDELLGDGVHTAAVTWNLLDAAWIWDTTTSLLRVDTPVGPMSLRVQPPTGCKVSGLVLRGLEEDDRVCGWESLYYGEKRPRPTLRYEVTGQCPMRIVTRVRLGAGDVDAPM